MLDWLPCLVPINPWTEKTYGMLYRIFCQDIRDYDLRYDGNEVWIFREMDDGKEEIFWHLTTRNTRERKIPRRKRKFFQDQDVEEQPRLPDMRRCERLSWVKPLIDNFAKPEIFSWDYEEGDRTIKTYVWIKDYDFVVIMKKYPDGRRRIITSFHVDHDYTKKDFERKHENRIR